MRERERTVSSGKRSKNRGRPNMERTQTQVAGNRVQEAPNFGFALSVIAARSVFSNKLRSLYGFEGHRLSFRTIYI